MNQHESDLISVEADADPDPRQDRFLPSGFINRFAIIYGGVVLPIICSLMAQVRGAPMEPTWQDSTYASQLYHTLQFSSGGTTFLFLAFASTGMLVACLKNAKHVAHWQLFCIASGIPVADNLLRPCPLAFGINIVVYWIASAIGAVVGYLGLQVIWYVGRRMRRSRNCDRVYSHFRRAHGSCIAAWHRDIYDCLDISRLCHPVIGSCWSDLELGGIRLLHASGCPHQRIVTEVHARDVDGGDHLVGRVHGIGSRDHLEFVSTLFGAAVGTTAAVLHCDRRRDWPSLVGWLATGTTTRWNRFSMQRTIATLQSCGIGIAAIFAQHASMGSRSL